MNYGKIFIPLMLVTFLLGLFINNFIINISDTRHKQLFVSMFLISYGVKYFIKHRYKHYIKGLNINYMKIFFWFKKFIESKKKDEKIKLNITNNKVHIEYKHEGETKYLILPYDDGYKDHLSKKVVYLINKDETEIEVTQISGIKYPSAKSIGGICYRVVDTITNEEIECDDPYKKNTN